MVYEAVSGNGSGGTGKGNPVNVGLVGKEPVMKVEKTTLSGVYLIKPDIFEDFRGNYTEVYNAETYRKAGIGADFVQDDSSTTYHGVLRGMHGDPKTAKLAIGRYQMKRGGVQSSKDA